MLLIAHELFDALPVHQFQWTTNGWKERLVDIDTKIETGEALPCPNVRRGSVCTTMPVRTCVG